MPPIPVRGDLRSAGAARTAVPAALLAVLAASNRWLGFAAGQRLVSAHDESAFRQIALAAPRLPSGRLANQHAQVFAFNYVVGLISDALPIGVETLFRVLSLLLIVAICACLQVALARALVTLPAFAVCMALLVLNTYSLRYYLLAVGYVTDLGFVLALAAGLLCLRAGRLGRSIACLAIATLGRQTAVPAALGF